MGDVGWRLFTQGWKDFRQQPKTFGKFWKPDTRSLLYESIWWHPSVRISACALWLLIHPQTHKNSIYNIHMYKYTRSFWQSGKRSKSVATETLDVSQLYHTGATVDPTAASRSWKLLQVSRLPIMVSLQVCLIWQFALRETLKLAPSDHLPSSVWAAMLQWRGKHTRTNLGLQDRSVHKWPHSAVAVQTYTECIHMCYWYPF